MSVEATKLHEGLAFDVQTNVYFVRSDVSEKLGGKNSGPNPHELLEAALAACTAITLQGYAQRKNIPLEYADVSIQITEEGASNKIAREVKLLGQSLTDEQKKTLMTIAEKCPIHKFLTTGAQITTKMANT